MKRVLGIIIAVLILGFGLSPGIFMAYAAAAQSAETGTSAYENFWRILNQEAELVVSVEDGNLSAVPSLISNSRAGEDNAANISAQIWSALEELENSGVKLYYTRDELRAMAQNISRNGLPQDTVETLKDQGWTDEQIAELEDYISRNADNITTGFNMSSFLENFSTAFVRVGFKYAGYESWAFEKWKWLNASNFTGSLPTASAINPLIASEWTAFYGAYIEGNTTGMLSSIESVSSRVYDLLTSPSYTARTGRLEGGSLLLRQEHVTGVEFYSGGFAVVRTSTTYYDLKNLKEVTITDLYYWPTALRAYNLTRQIYVITKAMALGNDNPELQWILNQKVDELKDTLKVYVSESVTERPIEVNPKPPIRVEPPKPPIGTLSSSGGGTLSGGVSSSQSTSGAPTTVEPTEIEMDALTLDDQEGILNADVSVVPVEVTDSYVKYKITVEMRAENNVVTGVAISVHGTGLEDSGHLDMIHPDDGTVSWTSKISGSVEGRGSVTVSGTVTITYTSNSGPMPSSAGDSVMGGTQTKELTLDYMKTIKLESSIDPAKVEFTVTPSDSVITAGKSVSFTVTIANQNDAPISGEYTLKITVPQDASHSSTVTYRKSVTVEDTFTLTTDDVYYNTPGEYGYYATFTFGDFQKTVSGTIDVRSSDNGGGGNQPDGSLEIIDATPSNPTPKDGDTVSFNVIVKNSYSSSRDVKLELFIDGSEVDSVRGNVSAKSTREFSLQWRALSAGLHSWIIGLWQNNTLKSWKNGTIQVDPSPMDVTGWLESNISTTVTTGTKAHFEVYVKSLVDEFTYNFPVIVEYSYIDPAGRVHEPITVIHSYVHQLDPSEEKNITWFDFKFDDSGKYLLTLFVNGTPVDDKTITVKPEGNVVAWMTCDDSVKLTTSFNCYVHVMNNRNNSSIHTELKAIEFSGVTIWNGTNWDAVRVSEDTGAKTTIAPNESKEIEFTVQVNGDLAKRIYGDGYYVYLFTPGDEPEAHWVSVKLQLGNSLKELGTTVFVYPGDDEGYSTIRTIEGAISFGGGVTTVVGAITESSLLAYTGVGLLFAPILVQDIANLKAPTPPGSNEDDGNLIYGDGG